MSIGRGLRPYAKDGHIRVRIRKALNDDTPLLWGIVEMDEACKARKGRCRA